jgi:hypothetical protein
VTADYREIYQQYAQGAIKACILINAGAAAALLTQSAKFIEMSKPAITAGLACGMLLWAVGAVVAIGAWIAAFFSSRYVDRSKEEVASTAVAEEEVGTEDQGQLVPANWEKLCGRKFALSLAYCRLYLSKRLT